MYFRRFAAFGARAVQLGRAVSVTVFRPHACRRILFDPLVAFSVLLAMIAAPGSTEPFKAPRRRHVRVVMRRLLALAYMVGGPLGAKCALLALWMLRGCGHAATLLLGGPVLWEPIRVPVPEERRAHYRRFLGYMATPGTACVLVPDGQRRIDALHALDVWEVYVGRRGWRFYVAA